MILTKINFVHFLKLLLNEQIEELEKHLRIVTFVDKENITTKQVDEGLQEISLKNLKEIYKEIKNKLTENKHDLADCIRKYIEVFDDFTLLFNINSKESLSANSPVMKKIEHLSLGVVAVLTFLFKFGQHANDNSPLIIDQPE